jgi:hypothetical protein
MWASKLQAIDIIKSKQRTDAQKYDLSRKGGAIALFMRVNAQVSAKNQADIKVKMT